MLLFLKKNPGHILRAEVVKVIYIFLFQIGVILRGSHVVVQVRFVTGNKILRILKRKGLAPDLPEDIYFLIKKTVSIRKHLERSRKDKDAKFRLILIESKIHTGMVTIVCLREVAGN